MNVCDAVNEVSEGNFLSFPFQVSRLVVELYLWFRSMEERNISFLLNSF